MKQIAFPEPEWALVTPAMPRPEKTRWGVIEWFLVGQTLLPALLYLHVFQPLRLPIRVGAFVVSLAVLVAAQFGRRASRHPSAIWLLWGLAYLLLMVFHPATNTFLAGFAQVMLYLAVLAPVFWGPAVIRTVSRLRKLLRLLLILNGINAAVGVLQVYDPGTWMPKEITALDFSGVVQIRTVSTGIAKTLSYKGPKGETVIRPTGLFDSPGAVAGPAMFAALIGFAFAAGETTLPKRLGALFVSLMGVSAIYLTQVRTSLVVLVGMLCVYLWTLIRNRRIPQAATLLFLSTILIAAAFSLALFLGGGSIRERFATLWANNPAEVYYASRGQQLEHGFTQLLIDHPFGAGLARWGMMRHYFGNSWNLNSPPIWAEIQFSTWILDGGFVLMFLYTAALIVSLRDAVRLATKAQSESLRSVASLVLAVNAGTAALCLSFTPFTTQLGIQYWLLSGALHGVADAEAQAAAGERRVAA